MRAEQYLTPKFQLTFMIWGLFIQLKSPKIIMSLTAPGCPVAGEMPGWVEDAINGTGGVRQVSVDLTWEPPWGMDMMSDEARLELGFM